MTDQEMTRRKADALYAYHEAALRVAHAKTRLEEIAATLRQVASALAEESTDATAKKSHDGLSEKTDRMLREQFGTRSRSPEETVTVDEHGVIKRDALIGYVRELRQAYDACEAKERDARSLGVDPGVHH